MLRPAVSPLYRLARKTFVGICAGDCSCFHYSPRDKPMMETPHHLSAPTAAAVLRAHRISGAPSSTPKPKPLELATPTPGGRQHRSSETGAGRCVEAFTRWLCFRRYTPRRGEILHDQSILAGEAISIEAGLSTVPCDRGRRLDVGGTASSVSSSQVQSGCAPWRIQCRDGNDLSMTTSIRQLTKSAA
jgi:hypothetical protein